MKQRLQELAQAWSELPPWAKRWVLKLAAAALLAAVPHIHWAPAQQATRAIAEALDEDALTLSTRDGGTQ